MAAASTSHLLHHLLRLSSPPRPPSSLLSIFLKRTVSVNSRAPHRKAATFCSSSISLESLHHEQEVVQKQDENYNNPINALMGLDDEEEEVSEPEEEVSESEEEVGEPVIDVGESEEGKVQRLKMPTLSVKEKKDLASYANSLGKKLKSQLVGKSGVTDSVAASFSETLEANELLKIKIHGTCPGELPDVVKRLEEATGSVVVGQIGRTVIIYRPSITKMKAEEKRQQHRRMFVRKLSTLRPKLEKNGPVARVYGQRRRGSNRD